MTLSRIQNTLAVALEENDVKHVYQVGGSLPLGKLQQFKDENLVDAACFSLEVWSERFMLTKRMFSGALLGLACAAIASASQAQAPGEEHIPRPQIEDLGDQRYRIGAIEIDKTAGSFSVAGEIIRHEGPFEFLVTTKNGRKSYESVLEANADAYEFNLACILIGLDAGKATPLEQRDFSQPVEGDPVEVTFSWTLNGKPMHAQASQFLVHGNPPKVVESNEWVYTGSEIMPGGVYIAHLAGTLLGFVQKGESVIEHRTGLGVGDYGSVQVNPDLAPAVGSAVEMTIKRVREIKTKPSPTPDKSAK